VYRGHIKAFKETYNGVEATALAAIRQKVLRLREAEELLIPVEVPVPSVPQFSDEDAGALKGKLEAMLADDASLDEESEEEDDDEEEEDKDDEEEEEDKDDEKDDEEEEEDKDDEKDDDEGEEEGESEDDK
jgi:ABC-type Zn2+ transport system substrate-binding protein/surface adhesin